MGTWEFKEPGRAAERKDGGYAEEDRKCVNSEDRGRVGKVHQDPRAEGTPCTIYTPQVWYRRKDQDCRGPNQGRRKSAPGSRALTPATLQEKRAESGTGLWLGQV
ncbi:hypothetical protein NDU88_007000 [Pleurodeles waltl]|uniref:Uncharacterized protein n=1 Tax=Pleurodeles waltl TaxID=8319 RepID=A0AAV7NZP4_PLEWA|nr:hypothetical protein NDU88_007000 [Pleurodeles waltl]